MKSILLASASVFAFAFAGAASAEIDFTADATLGYNDDSAGDNDGFYWDGNIDVTLSQELDNGVTAGANFDFDFVDANQDNNSASLGDNLEAGGYDLFIQSENASLNYGDISFAAESIWNAVGDMEQDGFSEADGEVALRGDVNYFGVEGSISYVLANNADEFNQTEELNQLSLGATADIANFNVVVAYQAETDEADNFYSGATPAPANPGDNGDFTDNQVFAIAAGTTLMGADVRLGYAQTDGMGTNDDEDSTGLEVSYPFGPVTVTGYFVSESDGDDNFGLEADYSEGPLAVTAAYADEQGDDIYSVEGSYDVGNGLVVLAGYLADDVAADPDDRFYVAGEYDLGGGAQLLAAYAEDDDNFDGDEIGGPEYQRGTTVEVSLEF